MVANSFSSTVALQDDEENQGGAAPATDMDGQHRAVRQEAPPFKVLDNVVRIEWQKRGYPHAHILLWADVPDVATNHRPEEAPDDVDWSDEEQREAAVPTCAEDLSDKYICTKSAHRWREDTRVEEGTREANAKLATMIEHKHGPYCGKYTIGSCRFGFERGPEKRTRRRTPQEQFSSRWKSSLAARRHEKDGLVGQYNMKILRFWRASMDLQVICELTCASRYILGYAFKSEEDMAAKRRMDDIMQGFLQGNGEASLNLTNQQIYKAGHAATQGRTTSTFEAVHLLLGYPVVFFSRDNEWVQVGPPGTWTLSVPQAEEEQALEDPAAFRARFQEDGRATPIAHRWYRELQQNFAEEETEIPVERAAPLQCKWKDITFLDFVAGFRFVGKNLPVPRRRPAIVGHRNFSPDQLPEEFYYSKLLLHTVWTEPGDWLQEEDCNSHTAAFHRIALDTERYPNFLQSVCFPMLDGTVQAARQLQAFQSVMFLKAKMDTTGVAHSRADENNYKDSIRIMQALKERHGEDIDFLAPDYVPTGPATDIYAPVEGGEALCISVLFHCACFEANIILQSKESM